MAPAGGDEPYITWLPHPDPAVEQMFRQANRDGFVIYRHEGVYTLVSPDGLKTMPFLGRVVPSSAIWRQMVGELRSWLDQTKNDESEGQG
jgi:hypothetical protein